MGVPGESRCEACGDTMSPDQLVSIGGKTVCGRCKADLVMNLKSGVSTSASISPARADEIRRRIRKLNLLSFAFALPGMGLQVLATRIPGPPGSGAQDVHATVLAIQGFGALLVIAGLVCYALMKGRSGLFGLLGVLSCLGLLILAVLSKICQNCSASASYRVKECAKCGAPV